MISHSEFAKIRASGSRAESGTSRTFLLVPAAFLAALLGSAATMAVFGIGMKGTTEALRVTGRLSLLLFWPAYAGAVFGRLNLPVLRSLARLRREFGLGFAAAHSVHAALVLWLFHIAEHRPVSLSTTVVDGIGLAWVYTLSVLSVEHLRRRLKPQVWHLLFNVGLEWIALVFLWDLLILPLQQGRELSLLYLPFTILILLAAVPRWLHTFSSLGHRLVYQDSRPA